MIKHEITALDCRDGMAAMPEGSVDLVVADPPYNIGYDYDVYDDRRTYDEYLQFSSAWISAVKRVLRPNGTFWLAMGDEYAADVKVLATRDLGFHCRSWVVWYYTFGVHCEKKFTRSHTHLFHLVKNKKDFTFDRNAIRVASARQRIYKDKRAAAGGRTPDDTWILRPQEAPDSFTPEEDVWYFSRVAGTFKERARFHGCQLPELMLARIIRSCSKTDDLVLDPFAGSGGTLIVAKKLGRQYSGFEISAGYTQQANARLANTAVGAAIAGEA